MQQHSLFENPNFNLPLAVRMRPETFEDFVGQEQVIGEGKPLRKLIEADIIPSIIFWGPPGVGKTTLARIIANTTKSEFVNFSAVTSGIKEIKQVMTDAEQNRLFGRRTILFVDEIHRFNRAQQDAFLPHVEKGSIILIGATTENPSFEINSALLSRCKVFVLKPLSTDGVVRILKNAISDIRGFGDDNVAISESQIEAIAIFSNGDARVALNTLEMTVLNSSTDAGGIKVSDEVVEQVTMGKMLLYDKNREEHYNLISALHKSMRNSDVDAAIYWLARMLEAGEDPLYIARRLVRFASEDVGMADSRALELSVAAFHACHFIGMPECSVNLTHIVTYLSLAPKSNSLYIAYGNAARDAKITLAEPVPLQIRNAPTKLMKELDYGKDYKYAHDYEDSVTDMSCLPESLADRRYYIPGRQGAEIKVGERIKFLESKRKPDDI
ncbi:MAG: replication-associated recombination protein A [Ruminococcaceae bacterium]|nr:replication-associated recombination protein A [Oscillospiraceae bacterium]